MEDSRLPIENWMVGDLEGAGEARVHRPDSAVDEFANQDGDEKWLPPTPISAMRGVRE
jgi:hypothetical protein